MAKVIYRGLADVRILDAKDMKSQGLEGFSKTEFKRFEPTEVSDEAAELILSKPRIFGKFERVTEDEAEQMEAQDAEAGDDTAEADSTSQLGVDSPAGTTASGTTVGGSSTGGSTRRSKA